MFNLNEFVMDTIDSMIGKEPEYKVRQYALGWYDKEVINNEDLAYIDRRYAEMSAQEEAYAGE